MNKTSIVKRIIPFQNNMLSVVNDV